MHASTWGVSAACMSNLLCSMCAFLVEIRICLVIAWNLHLLIRDQPAPLQAASTCELSDSSLQHRGRRAWSCDALPRWQEVCSGTKDFAAHLNTV